ncbi:beta-ketoacyl synthase N-terminal-like domain-containing protein [Rheinheimera salexigens]|uniref:Ketosynthase family 3 (KS3) domain-containing protein n=1 Tax=Rheinheimera salexigens TaxID=1628148 RepID=A0A1E7Q2T0_9GAMM|nr:beta-ketoacyl synthase N-terminal-like domain-containing protein [Rheinheimera salexigens]OEY68431.1 hypothetical protein BI198_01755 [Rheinheimera salexigens]
MTAVYLSQFHLSSALATDLPQAAARYAKGELPLPSYAEDALSLPYFAVTGADLALHERLHQLLQTTLDAAGLAASECLLLVASTALDVSLLEQRLEQGQPLSYALMPSFDSFKHKLTAEFDFAAVRIINTACTSAANALLYGQRLLQAGLYRHVLILAFEPPGKITRSGFSTLELTSSSGQYRPFHPQRDGLILGEAYATVVVSTLPDNTPTAELLGGYSACDTYNITTTSEDGSHIAQVMQLALEQSRVNPAHLALLKLHGTATPANDTAEQNGIRRLFADKVPPLAVLKPYLGHTLGACGLSELALLFASAQESTIPALPYASEASLPFSHEEVALKSQDIVMANFFGFGGNNASLLLRKC